MTRNAVGVTSATPRKVRREHAATRRVGAELPAAQPLTSLRTRGGYGYTAVRVEEEKTKVECDRVSRPSLLRALIYLNPSLTGATLTLQFRSGPVASHGTLGQGYPFRTT